jgi:DNA polymerase III subunit delta
MPNENILFLYGNDEFAISRRLNELQQLHDKDGMNTIRLEARAANEEELNSAVNAMPFLGEKRLVFLANPSARSSVPSVRQKFLDFLKASPASTLVVMHESLEAKEAKEHWLVKRAGKGEFKAETFFMPRLKDMSGWIIKEAKSLGGGIEPLAAVRLAEMVGENTRQATQELTKLFTYVNQSRAVTLADVEKVSVVSAQASIFSLVDALALGDTKQAQGLLHRLLEEEEAFSLWGMIIRQFRLLLQAREILDAHGTLQDAQRNIHEAPYSVDKAYSQAKHLQMPVLEDIYHRLLEMDEASKTGEMPLDAALDAFVVEIALAPSGT